MYRPPSHLVFPVRQINLWTSVSIFFVMPFFMAISFPSQGQDKICSSPKPSENQIQLMEEALKNQGNLRTSSSIKYVPIKPFVVRKSDGSGGVTLGDLNQTLVNLNNTFKEMNVEFFFSKSGISYIDDSKFFNFSNKDESLLADPNDVNDAINIYFLNSIQIDGFGESGGYAYYPGADAYTNRIFVINAAAKGGHMLSHELGHYFGLVHTFEREGGLEFVTRGQGSNCSYTGDRICDTPADPYGLTGVTIEACTYTGTIKDPNGDAYAPPLDNIMSYYNHCAQNFTAAQFERMRTGLKVRESQRNYNLEGLPESVNAPENLSVNKQGESFILNWIDKSDNETGFIVERSDSPNNDFIPVIGLAPNSTSFTDKDYETITNPYYRVKASNAPTSLSTVANFCPGIKEITAISGTTEVCLGKGSESYSVEMEEGVFYEWKVSSGGKLTSLGHIAQVEWENSGVYELSVTPINACGRGPAFVTKVSVSDKVTKLKEIAGQAKVCNSEYTYSVEELPGMEYFWTVSGGGNLIATGNSATVLWNSGGTYKISVVPSNACGEGEATSLEVEVLETSSFERLGGIQADRDRTCLGKQNFSIDSMEGVDYLWSIPEGSGKLVTNGNLASVDWKRPGTHIVSVTPKNSCGSGKERSFKVYVEDNKEKPQITLTGSRLQSNLSGKHNWFFNDQLIAGASGPVCPATMAGNYTVQIVSECGLGPMSDVYTLYQSIEEKESLTINLYPNPASDHLSVELPDDVGIQTIHIINSSGEIVFSADKSIYFDNTIRGNNFKKLMTIDLQAYVKGMYVLNIHTDNAVINRRFILR